MLLCYVLLKYSFTDVCTCICTDSADCVDYILSGVTEGSVAPSVTLVGFLLELERGNFYNNLMQN